MKTKNVVFIGIAVCAISLLLISPVLANEDETLDIYGNANLDDTIDMRDITYTARIICLLEEETYLADANYDEEVDVFDMWQEGLIILGRESELTIVDSLDRTVTIDMPVERIAGLHSSASRELCKLEVQDRVVGVDKYSLDDIEMYPGLEGKPNIGGVFSPNYEKIVEVDPDILVMGPWMSLLEPVEEKLDPFGIKVVAFGFTNPPLYESDLKSLGFILGKEERAKDYIKWMHEIEELIEDHTKDIDEKKKVFASSLTDVLAGKTELMCSFKSSTAADTIIKLAGGVNIAAEFSPNHKVSGEWLIYENPDTIILGSFFTKQGFGYSLTDEILAKESLDQALAHEILCQTEAAEEEQIYIFAHYGLASGGQHPLGALYLAKRLYPEHFEDVNPEDFLRVYFEEWFNIPYQGVWAYPGT